MTKAQIALVQESFTRLAHDKARFGARFFAVLFELEPGFEPKFAAVNMDAHGNKLMAALSFVVGALREPASIVGPVQSLGARHAGYGLSPVHYGTTGRALLLTLSEFLEDIWSAELCAAWNAAFNIVAGLMLAGAQKASVPLAA